MFFDIIPTIPVMTNEAVYLCNTYSLSYIPCTREYYDIPLKIKNQVMLNNLFFIILIRCNIFHNYPYKI